MPDLKKTEFKCLSGEDFYAAYAKFTLNKT